MLINVGIINDVGDVCGVDTICDMNRHPNHETIKQSSVHKSGVFAGYGACINLSQRLSKAYVPIPVGLLQSASFLMEVKFSDISHRARVEKSTVGRMLRQRAGEMLNLALWNGTLHVESEALLACIRIGKSSNLLDSRIDSPPTVLSMSRHYSVT